MSNLYKTISMASDHAGFWLKEFIKLQLTEEGYVVKDFGTSSVESVDYSDFIHPLAKAINDGKYEKGIIVCGSGQGAQMTANKYTNVRAGLCWNVEQAELIRKHNNANVLSLPGRFVSLTDAWKITQVFLTTSFDGGRHERRVQKIGQIL